MLTALLSRLPAPLWHRALRALGVDPADFHEWLPGFCPCPHSGAAVAA